MIKNATITLAAITAVVFVLQIIFPAITENFSLMSSEVFARPWTILTSIFLHGGIEHLMYNMFALVLFGLILEEIVGSRKFLLLYFSSGLIASLATIPFYNASLGASGAVFGILGALAILRPKMVVWINFIPVPMFLAIFIWAAIDLFGFFFPTNIANAAHLAGLILGVLYGLYLRGSFGEKFFHKHKHSLEISEEKFRDWEDRNMQLRNIY
ncbi:MAG TPA: rhomboid family intramembrane serine protease [archaeon]|nr:rhomboid family intramembrane serine protease [archaeon]